MKTLALIILWLGLAGPTSATVGDKQVTVVTGNQYAPYSDESLPEGGLATDLVRRVFRRMGYTVEVNFLPWKRGYYMAKEAHFLGTFPYVKDAQRQQDFLYSAPLIDIEMRFFIRKNAPFHYQSAADLENKQLCRPLGYTLEPLKGKILTDKAHLWRPPTLNDCFKLVLAQRIAAVPLPELVGWSTIRSLGYSPEDFETYPYVLNRNQLHFIISKTYPNARDWMNRFNQALEELQKEGVLDALLKKQSIPSASR